VIRGYSGFYWWLPFAKISIDDAPASGYVHHYRGAAGQDVVITHVGSTYRRETYWVVLPIDGDGSARRCSDWAALPVPVFVSGDLNPPCFEGWFPATKPVWTNGQSLEFTADDGKRLRVSW